MDKILLILRVKNSYFILQKTQQFLMYQHKILDQGKIRGRIEYELAIDSIIVAEQDGRITKEDSHRLGEMIDKYQFKQR